MGYELILNKSKLMDLAPDNLLHSYLKNFDIFFYRNFPHWNGKSDLLQLSDEDLLSHFVRQGKLEGRPYNKFLYSFIDPIFYRNKYPHLGKLIENDSKAISHWLYYGAYENYVPNVVAQRLLDAKFHLFQMGKVGSKSIQAAIAETGHQLEVPHLHFSSDLIFSYPDSYFSYKEIVNFEGRDPIYFISGVRDPILRLLSGILQSIGEDTSSVSEAQVDDLLNTKGSLQNFLDSQLETVVNWFEHCYFSDIDVYRETFDTESGWSVVKGEKHSIFLYRQDKLSNCWEALSKFTELNLKPTTINLTSQKLGINKMASRLFEVRFDEIFISKVFNTKYCQHFFSESELNELKSKWCN